ncbi:hypothetical protein J6590_021193 [Homalodisca vitripennis]|nr:hypothetical protein J6590_021193 [Homalodisca vitripennis]
MGEPVSSGPSSRQHRPWESGKSYARTAAGEGVVGSPTSLVDIFDTAFGSEVDQPADDCLGDMELDPLFADSDGGEDVDVVEPSPSRVWYPRQSDHYSAPWSPSYFTPEYQDSYEARRKRSLETDAFLKPKKSNERVGLDSGPGPSSGTTSDVTRQFYSCAVASLLPLLQNVTMHWTIKIGRPIVSDFGTKRVVRFKQQCGSNRDTNDFASTPGTTSDTTIASTCDSSRDLQMEDGKPIESAKLISFCRQSGIGCTTAGNPVSSPVNYLPERLLRTCASFIHYRLARPDVASPEPPVARPSRRGRGVGLEGLGGCSPSLLALEKEEGGRDQEEDEGRWEDQVWKDIERRGLQKIQVDEEETWKDRLKWRRLCTTTRENGNV